MHRTIHTSHYIHAIILAMTFAFSSQSSGQVVNEIRKFLADDGEAFDGLGHSVSISNGIVAVSTNGSGAVYLFSASTGAQLAKLVANDGAANDQFGYSVSIENGIVAIGAPFNDGFGSVYIFDAAMGTQIRKIVPKYPCSFVKYVEYV